MMNKSYCKWGGSEMIKKKKKSRDFSFEFCGRGHRNHRKREKLTLFWQ